MAQHIGVVAKIPGGSAIKRRAMGAICFMTAALVYLLSETFVAAAWSTPRYSYANNYISDLGVAGCGHLFHGRLICSPWYPVMNAGFIAEGLLYSLACLLVLRFLPNALSRFLCFCAALFYGVGMVLVGLFHGSQAALLDGTLRYHFAGATLAIGTGNIVAIATAAIGGRLGLPVWTRAVSAVLGCIGIASALLLLHKSGLPPGLPERGSVYTIMFWEILVGVMLLRTVTVPQ